MATFINSFKNRAISIPLIQRDYVQSFSADVIESFVEQLIDVLCDSSGAKSMNLNYIYGIDKIKGQVTEFEPVDGQQRLTTLWLFCLYISRHPMQENTDLPFDIRLIYQSREYADAFCAEIVRHKAWAKNPKDLETQIRNQYWFVPEWEKDTSVIAMIKALGIISRKLARIDGMKISYIWKRLNSAACPVTFAFYPTDTFGDDIYIKMNGRGRSLTSFENLKSWIDERLNNYISATWHRSYTKSGVFETFFYKWKDEMDNAWTNLFWSNRETGDYEIDDMQQRLFYNLVYLYWSLEDRSRILSADCDLEDIAFLLNLSSAKVTRDDVIEAILSRIIKSSSYSLPLYILDKINLIPLKFILWFQKVMNGLCSINDRLKEITDNEIFFWGKSIDKESGVRRTLLYQIMMSEKGQERVSMEKLALCYALCKYACFHDKTVTPLNDWIYRCRNLVLNNSFDRKTFGRALEAISSLFENSREVEIDILLNQDNLRLDQFPDKYLKLEKYKSEIILSGNPDLSAAMKILENKRFFVGSILCIPILIPSKEAVCNPSKFIKICDILSSVINSEGPRFGDKFRRALLYFSEPSVGYGGWESGIWSFLYGKNDWQWYFNDAETDKSIRASNRKALKGLVDYLLPLNTEYYERGIDNLISLGGTVDDEYPVLPFDDWRYPFVYNAKVFAFMNVKCCRRNPPYDIILSKSTVIRTNADHVSLQTFMLYREYKDGKSSLGDGWKSGLYLRENSCVVFEKGELRITVEFFYYENKADAYSIRVFIDTSDDSPQNIHDSRIKLIVDNLAHGQKYSFTKDDGLRINGLSYGQVKTYLANFMTLT